MKTFLFVVEIMAIIWLLSYSGPYLQAVDKKVRIYLEMPTPTPSPEVLP